jgi:GntR family transcriptional regulator/MocR family aminotransferase
VEDDYDGEFYYGSQPQPPLKSIDTQDRVIYVGTFSKSLFPSLRVGYILSPPSLIDTFSRVSSNWLSGVPTATQAIVADFMNEGLFANHIRAMRQAYKARHDALIDAAAALKGRLDVRPASSGFHTVGFLPGGSDEHQITEAAKEKNLIVAPLSRYCSAPIQQRGLVLGFGGVDPDQIRRGVAVLDGLLDDLRVGG